MGRRLRANERCVIVEQGVKRFITAGPITKLCAWGEEESAGRKGLNHLERIPLIEQDILVNGTGACAWGQQTFERSTRFM